MRTKRRVFLFCSLLAALAACGSPDNNTDISCGPNGECPLGYQCEPVSRRCVKSGTVRDAGIDAAPPAPDAAIALDTQIGDKPAALSGPTAVFSFTATVTGATFECSLDGAAFAACVSPLTVSSLADGSHTFAVRAVAGGQRDSTPASYTWNVSSTVPVTTITSQPPAVTGSTQAMFVFSASPSGSTTECSLDGAAFSACTSPKSYTDLKAGDHRFSARATSPSGVKETSPPEVRWTIDLTGPTVTITAPAASATTGKTVHLTYTASETVVRFECAADSGAFSACGSGTSGATDLVYSSGGAHTASVRAVDAAGNTGPVASVSITIDATPPVVRVSTRTGACASEPMRFAADETATFTCAIDGGTAAACTSPYSLTSGVSGGSHRFTVVGTDAYGNAADPVTVSFDLDLTAPVVTFDGTLPAADARGYSDATGAVRFHSDGTAVSYRCALDRAAAADCTPVPFTDAVSYSYLNLTEAGNPHGLAVTAADACGNVSSPQSFSFSVDTTGPTYTLGRISAAADTGQVVVPYTESEPAKVRSCTLDGFTCDTCTATGATCTGASAGEHVFTVQGSDLHGNAGAPVSSSPVVMRYGPNAGHAILIGHDFAQSSADIELLLRNAFDQVPYRVRGLFDRGLRVAAFVQSSAAPGEVDNALAAIASIVDPAAVDQFSAAGDLTTALQGKDVLLVPDQQDPTGSPSVGKLWGSALVTFLERGGVVVVLDGMMDAQTPSGTYAVLGADVLAISASADVGNTGSTDFPARRVDDLNDPLHADDISPLSVGTSYLTTPTTVVFALGRETGAPRWVYARVARIGTVPIVLDKIFPVYDFSTGLAATVGPYAAVPFQLTPATAYRRVDCTAANLSCSGQASCACNDAGATTCACAGDLIKGFRLPAFGAGSYRVDLRLVDPYGSPGRAATSRVQIDMPAITITAGSIGVFCYRGTTVDNRSLSYSLYLEGKPMTTDAVKNASCAAADVGSFTFRAACGASYTFTVDAVDGYGNWGGNSATQTWPCL